VNHIDTMNKTGSDRMVGRGSPLRAALRRNVSALAMASSVRKLRKFLVRSQNSNFFSVLQMFNLFASCDEMFSMFFSAVFASLRSNTPG